MESYGLALKQNLILEYVKFLPTWKTTDIGRLIYDLRTRRCYFGKDDGWIIIGFYSETIKKSHLVFDNSIEGFVHTISALRIPIILDVFGKTFVQTSINNYKLHSNQFGCDVVFNVQVIYDAIFEYLNSFDFTSHNLLINSLSLNDSITASNIYSNMFLNNVQYDLNILLYIQLSNIELSSDSIFGNKLGFASVNLDDVFNDIIHYLDFCSADDIIYTTNIYSTKLSIQTSLDDMYHRSTNLNLIDLIDGPDYYSTEKFSYYSTNGHEQIWKTFTSKNINIKLPNFFKLIKDVEDPIIIEAHFCPQEECSSESIENTLEFNELLYSPQDYYSTGLQQALELIRNIQCLDPRRSTACEPILLVNSIPEFSLTSRVEQHRNDGMCYRDSSDDSTNCRDLKKYGTDCVFSSNPTTIAQMKIDLKSLDRDCRGCYEALPTGPNVIDFEDVYENWQRYVTPGEETYWQFNNGIIYSTNNTQYPQYFVSPTKYNRYSFELTVRSNSDWDDDFLYIVIAHTGSHNLCVIRCRGGTGQDTSYPTYFLAMDFGMEGLLTDHEIILASAPNCGGSGAWGGTFSRLFVCRYDDTVSIACSQFGSETVDPNTRITFKLTSDPRLEIFRGPQKVGFGTYSQDGYFLNPDLHPISMDHIPDLPVPCIYDKSEATLWYWNSNNCSWEPNDVEFPCGGYVDIPGPCNGVDSSSCSNLETETRYIYNLYNNFIYEWNTTFCVWAKVRCPQWDIFEKNTIYFNDITCKLFWYTCDGTWFPLN